MSTRVGDGIDELGPQLSGKPRQVAFRKAAKIGRDPDHVQERGIWRRLH